MEIDTLFVKRVASIRDRLVLVFFPISVFIDIVEWWMLNHAPSLLATVTCALRPWTVIATPLVSNYVQTQSETVCGIAAQASSYTAALFLLKLSLPVCLIPMEIWVVYKIAISKNMSSYSIQLESYNEDNKNPVTDINSLFRKKLFYGVAAILLFVFFCKVYGLYNFKSFLYVIIDAPTFGGASSFFYTVIVGLSDLLSLGILSMIVTPPSDLSSGN